MIVKQLAAPSELWAFYEQKKEALLTKEEERFAKKVFQYATRLLNGVTLNINRASLNQKALVQAALIWIKEYNDFKKGYTPSHASLSHAQEKRTIIQPEKIEVSKVDSFSDAMTDVLGGMVYTADNQYTMMRVCPKSIFNEKRRGEHKYPRQRN